MALDERSKEAPAEKGDGNGNGRGASDLLVIRVRKVHLVGVALAVVFYLIGFFTHDLLVSPPKAAVDAEEKAYQALEEENARLWGQLTRLQQDLVAALKRKGEGEGELQGSGSDRPARRESGTAQEAQAQDALVVSADDDPAWGPQDAPVVIIEFSDFQCPFCERFFKGTLPRIKSAYEGKVRFVYRDFPLSFHKNAQISAEAAECADEQGKFWEMHDRLFGHQAEWSDSDEPDQIFADYAQEIGLDVAQFRACLESGRFRQEVQKDFADGRAYGVNGTPTFFINGRALVGAQPFAAFKAVIDEELSKAGARSRSPVKLACSTKGTCPISLDGLAATDAGVCQG